MDKFMGMSKYAIEAMGFSEIPAGTRIEATFNLILVYNIEGLKLNGLSPETFSDVSHVGDDFSIAFGNSINEITNSMLADNFTDDESEWAKEKKANPPYLVIHLRLKDPSICVSGYWKKDGEILSTYDSFSGAKKMLRDLEQKIVPGLVSSLTVHFSKIHIPMRFKKIDRAVFGITPTGQTVIDSKATVSARGFTSQSVNPKDVKPKIESAVKHFGTVDPKVTSLFHAGLEEEDRFKQFLNFFHAIEIHTNQIFLEIKFEDYDQRSKSIPDRLKLTGENFDVNKTDSVNLKHRFIWCSILIWKSLDDSDVKSFKDITDIRNKLSHGSKIPDPKLPNEALEKLMLKIV